MQLDNNAEAPRRINITPLIDVVFILLMFFMLATRLDQIAVINLNPQVETEATTVPSNHKDVVLFIDPDGRVSVEGTAFSGSALESKIKTLSNPSLSTTRFIIKGSDESHVQHLVSVLDLFNRLNITQVEIH